MAGHTHHHTNAGRVVAGGTANTRAVMTVLAADAGDLPADLAAPAGEIMADATAVAGVRMAGQAADARVPSTVFAYLKSHCLQIC